jgi:hypothetical protein
MRKPLATVLSESGRAFLEQACVELSGGFLNEIQQYDLDGTPKKNKLPTEVWIRVADTPKFDEIDHHQTSDDMLFDNKAILIDGRHITW